jgi:FkbM family methyltransferase
MRYNFIEIGTCDYDTLLESCSNNEIGLSIEPIKLYLDRLPNKPNVTKINVAISSEDKIVDLFWVEPENQKKYNIEFTKGWGTIISPHRWHTEAEMMLSAGILSKNKIETITWNTLIKRYKIESVDYVKIDTEGHDCVIINSILQSTILPKKISFEKTHCPKEQLDNTYYLLLEKQYIILNDSTDNISWIKL